MIKKGLRLVAAGLSALLLLAAAGSSYVVKRGDTLSTIADDFDTTVARIHDALANTGKRF